MHIFQLIELKRISYLYIYINLAVIALVVLSVVQIPESYYFIPLVIALTLLILVLKTLPAVFDKPESHRILNTTEKEQRNALWLIHLRWIFLTAAFIFIFITIKILKFLPEETWLPLLLTILLITVYNIIFRYLRLNRNIGNLSLQIYFDLLALTVIIHFSGGIENPLSLLPIFHVIISGIILSKNKCYMVAAVANLVLGGLFLLEWSEFIKHYTILIFTHGDHGDFHVAHHTMYVFSRILLNLLVLFLIAFFTTILSEWAQRNEREARNLAGRIIKIQEDERSRIAKEIHENIGSSLYALKLLTHSTFSEIKVNNNKVEKEYNNLIEYLNSVMEDTRKISHSLSPVILERIGLFEAIEELIKTYTRNGKVQISMDAFGLNFPFNHGEKIHVYRIVQEALVNIVRHSQATKAKIVTRQIDGSLLIRIIDNGIGMSTFLNKAAHNHLSLGLIIMKERALLLGAHLSIKSKKYSGTVIEIEIPRKES